MTRRHHLPQNEAPAYVIFVPASSGFARHSASSRSTCRCNRTVAMHAPTICNRVI
jgi:hypothetical protein